MAALYKEFFWTPAETNAWLCASIDELGLWVVSWMPGEDAKVIHDYDIVEESEQIFLGHSADLSDPVWIDVRGRRELDFHKSYAVQLIVPLLVDNVLLEGRMAISGKVNYTDRYVYERLSKLFGKLCLDILGRSDQDYIVMQKLADGSNKRWSDILVGPEAAARDDLILKQFIDSPISFEIVRARI